MSSKVKAITLRARYESDLSGIQKDLASLKSIRRRLEKSPIRIPLALDLSGIKSQAAKAAREYSTALQKEMAKARPMGGGGAMSPGGIAIPSGAMRSMENYAGASGKVFKTVTRDAGTAKQAVTSFEQVMRGVQRQVTEAKKKGKMVSSSSIIDTSPIEKMKASMEGIDAKFAEKIGTAKGTKGDVAKVLENKRAEIDNALKGFSALKDTPEYRAIDKTMGTLRRQIAEAGGRQSEKSSKEQVAGRRGSLKDAMAKIDDDFTKGLGSARGNRGDVASVLSQKRQRIADELAKYGDIASSPEFRSAQKSISSMSGKIAETVPRQEEAARKKTEAATKAARMKAEASEKASRANASKGATRTVTDVDRARGARERGIDGRVDNARHIRDETTRTQELNRALDDREKLLGRTAQAYDKLEKRAAGRGDTDAAGKFRTAKLRTEKDLGGAQLERKRGSNAAASAAEDRGLSQKITALAREHTLASQKLDDEEKTARAVKKRSQREAELNRILRERRALSGRISGELGDVHRKATNAGRSSIADRATTVNNGVMDKEAAANRRIGKSARDSGHAIDFHSNSLLRNAATFTQWFIPAQLVMGAFSGIAAGARNAVDAQRTFKTLNAVFRGTREESELLARQTLQLAAANGRGAQEAAEAAVSWARLGLTRTQVLLAMETSLRAANVAEISTADATKYLTAQYKAFNQTLTDIPGNLDYINSLSNNLNVTPENIFQGIARTATVAKQAGVEYKELGAIIAKVSDVTGRPGEETGNAMKFILTRIRRPETLDNIKDEFDLDLRKPNGDAKAMMDIFGELADLYPSLNRLEKARINDLVAGSRQTERYAVIVDNFTEILGNQAKASFDANSAQRENAEILSSLDAGLQQVSTGWTAFMAALGESGAFSVASGFLQGLKENLDDFTEARNRANTANPKGKSRQAFDDFSAEEQRLLNAGDYTKEGVGITDAAFERRLASAKRNIGAAIKGGKDSPEYQAIQENYSEMNSGRELKTEDLYKFHSKFVLGKGSSDVATGSTQLAMDYAQDVSEVDGLNKSGDTFRKMSKDILKESIDPNKMLKQFDDFVELLEKLPGGLKNVAEARLNIQPMMVSGNRKGASEALAGVADRFETRRDIRQTETETGRIGKYAMVKKNVEILQSELTVLNKTMASVEGEKGQESYALQIEKTTDKLREQEEAIKSLSQAAELKDLSSISAAQSMRLDEYYKDTDLAQETIGTAISGMGNTGIPGLDMKIKAGGALMQRDLARESLAMTQANNQAYADENAPFLNAYQNKKPNEFFNKDFDADVDRKRVEAIRNTLTLNNELESSLTTQLSKIEKITESVERKLELERQAAMITEAGADGRSYTANVLGSFAIGENQGEQITNQTRGALGIANDIAANPQTGAGDALSDARELGQLSEALTQSKQGLASMEQRMYSAVAGRANLEIEITENAKKQREEATKRLALASREDQLRAAAASAVLKNRGSDSFSMQEFQFFGQETKGALSNLMPGSVKGLDDTERENNRSRNKLDREIAGIAESLAPMLDTFEEVRRLSEETARQLAEGLRPEAVDGNDTANLDKRQALVNVQLGEVTINTDIAPQIGKMMDTLETRFNQRISSEMESLRRRLSNPFAVDNSPAAAAF